MPISTIALIIYFSLIALDLFHVWTAPGILVAVVAAVIAIALVTRN